MLKSICWKEGLVESCRASLSHTGRLRVLLTPPGTPKSAPAASARKVRITLVHLPLANCSAPFLFFFFSFLSFFLFGSLREVLSSSPCCIMGNVGADSGKGWARGPFASGTGALGVGSRLLHPVVSRRWPGTSSGGGRADPCGRPDASRSR